MTPEARAELNRIEDFLMRNDKSSAQVMAVLTALRGEDKDESGFGVEVFSKTHLTVPVRRAAFPRMALAGVLYEVGKGETAFGMGIDSIYTGKLVLAKGASRHFRTHVRMAAEALGLEVE